MKNLIPTVTLICLSFVSLTFAATLEVGDDKAFQQIEKAVAAAKPGDEIVVYLKQDGSAYRQPVLLVRTPKLTIRAADPQKPVELDGNGFTYSGVGNIPRAIVQFDPEASGSTLDGFRLINARNDSHNGAGARINQANDVTIRNCEISDNDMGIMSNGEAPKQTAARQLIEKCKITNNGTAKHPGYNHNLYLGGTSVTVQECEIANAVTGHNLKSRAHLNFIIKNNIHDSSNRELDLVDAEGTTDIVGSHSFLIENTITKAPKCTGNKAVIHFGRDGKASHNGTIWLIRNTIHTPFISPVVDVSSGDGAVFIDNIIDDTKANQIGVLANLQQPAMKAWGSGNTIPARFILQSQQKNVPMVLEQPPELPKELQTILPHSSQQAK
ncbi:MAG: right-handed parallel beta-helix repeat-containing protein [Phycisphaerales bacterium]|nr:right-handed parallel beta-helix repeat-containing protein [Phycisphaerales bacterium]